MNDPKSARLAAIQALDIPLEPRILERAASPALAGLRPRQRVLFTLLVATLEHLKGYQFQWWRIIIQTPVLIVLAGVAGYGVLALLGTMINLLAEQVGGWLLNAYYAIPMLVGGVLGYLIKKVFEEDWVGFRKKPKKTAISSLHLGRVSGSLNPNGLAMLMALFGLTVAAQVFVLRYLPDHAGLAIDGTFETCLLLTTDNICHGVFLDTFELYDISLGDKVKHNLVSATIFFLFRIAFDAYAVLIGVIIYRRHKIKALIADFPTKMVTLERMTAWLGRVCDQDHSWPRRYFDEFMFLCLCRYYLSDDIPFIRDATAQFPRLRIRAEVRDLFTDENDAPAFVFIQDDRAGPNRN